MPRVKSNMKILHIDIETAPTNVYVWNLWPKFIGVNDVVQAGYTLCWAASWDGERDVKFASIHTDGKDRMLTRVCDLLDEADAVVHYNGTKFDMPILNREFIKAGIEPPSHYHQIDLLKTVRKQFRFESNKLDFVAQQLGLGAKTHHKGMALWYGCMEGDVSDWKTMERYNKQDVRLTKKLYKKLLPWIHNHPTQGMWVNDPLKPTCPTCSSTDVQKKGTQFNTKTASYERYKCNGCGAPLRSRLRNKPTSANVLVRTP